MPQVSYGTITINDITDISDVYLEYGLAVANATITNSYTFNRTGEIGWSTTYPTWASGYQIWIRQVTKKEGIVQPEYGTPYLDTAVNQINTRINIEEYEREALAAKVKNFWWDSTGAHVASGINGADVNQNNISTYGFNSLVGLSSLTFGYNSYNTVKLDASNTPVLYFYEPSKTSQGAIAATLNSHGLNLSKGGIEAGSPGVNGYIYFSTEDYPLKNSQVSPTISGLTINGYTPTKAGTDNRTVDDSAWRQVIGTNFGVTADGSLYANGVNISGTLKSSSDAYNYYEFLPNGLFNIVVGATTANNPKSGDSFIVFEQVEGTSNRALSIQLSDLYLYLGKIYEQDETHYELNILNVMDIINYQQELMTTWNGSSIYQYTSNGITYDLEQYTYNGSTKYYYDINAGEAISDWQQYNGNVDTLPIILEGGLNGSLEFIPDSLGHRQSLLVSSATEGDIERSFVTIDPHFINLKVTDDNSNTLGLELRYKPKYKLTTDTTYIEDTEKIYYELITDDNTGESIYKQLINLSDGINPSSLGLYELDNGKGVNAFNIFNNNTDIINIKEENNYFLETKTGFQFENMGLFHYKNGLAIGIV